MSRGFEAGHGVAPSRGFDPATSSTTFSTQNQLRQHHQRIAIHACSLYFNTSSPAYDTLMPRKLHFNATEAPILRIFWDKIAPNGGPTCLLCGSHQFYLLLLLLFFYKSKGKANRITQAADYIMPRSTLS